MELKGIAVSPGIAVGEALLVEREAVPLFRLLLQPEHVELEVQRLSRAVAVSREQLQAIKQRLSKEVGSPHAYIFDAQLLMLDDPLLVDRSVAVIREEHVNAGWALRTVAEQLHALFDEFNDAYLKERSTDLDDLLGRVQLNLAGAADAPSLSRLPRAHVLVAQDVTPSEAAELDWERVLAVVTDAGSATSHTAILARSLGVPAVAGVHDAAKRIPAGALVVVDGTRGVVEVEPSQPSLAGYRAAQQRAEAEEERLQQTRALPALTRDGVAVRLLANAEFLEEAATAVLYGAQGIGLFRSEYLLGRSRRWPDEDKQVEAYRSLLAQVHPHPVTIRTWDVGAEELAPGGPSSPNPALGERALRLLVRDPAPFRTQLRAILRAATAGPLRIMFPFVAGPADLRAALELLEEAKRGLRLEGVAMGEQVPVGLNLELPSAALTVDLLARDVDFFSVGTNDLIQYLLAVDREDPRVARLYEPLHPAVVRTLRLIVEAAQAAGRPLSVCGEMAADPLQALLLVGLGVRELSMSPSAVPRVKAALRAGSFASAREAALGCLALSSASEIEHHLREALGSALQEGLAVQPEGA
jgi:phosphotransferase system enzyme I (PtsI)